MDESTRFLQGMINELLSWGYSQMDISRKTGVRQSVISSIVLSQAKSATYDSGRKIEAMYNGVQRNAKRAQKAREQRARLKQTTTA